MLGGALGEVLGGVVGYGYSTVMATVLLCLQRTLV